MKKINIKLDCIINKHEQRYFVYLEFIFLLFNSQFDNIFSSIQETKLLVTHTHVKISLNFLAFGNLSSS